MPERVPPHRFLRALLALLAAWPLSELINAQLETPLRQSAAAVSQAMLTAAGVRSVRSGTTLTTKQGRFEVLLPCSGGKFLSATLSLGFVAVALGRASRRRMGLTAGILIPLAVVGNSGRVFVLVLLGAPVNPFVHTVLGLLCFGTVATIVVLLTEPSLQ